MRIILAAMLAVMIAGCSSILLGNATTGERGAPSDTRGSAQVAADNEISATIRRNLAADPVVSRYTIAIRSVDGNVTLSGTVGSFTARDHAVQIATDTDGVRSVRNQIAVNTNL